MGSSSVFFTSNKTSALLAGSLEAFSPFSSLLAGVVFSPSSLASGVSSGEVVTGVSSVVAVSF